MAELVVRPEARDEVLATVDYYQEHAGRGEDFAGAVGATFTRILGAPSSFPPTRGVRAIRGAKVRGYPYRVFFVEKVDHVLVVAVAHERRRPGYWRGRLR